MSTTQQHAVGECGLVPPSWRMGAFVLIQIVIVILVAAGCPAQTALACVAGAGMTAVHLVRGLFGLPVLAREAR
ncbi:hypothetical protein [Streptomyces sp. NPDC059378]|uniref:hypothetical protein n=1 Tax=Streptomyces sp. NPDC059378 TaxID=3346815 RepID=UPI0036A3AEBC